jgi:hypothetical protein
MSMEPAECQLIRIGYDLMPQRPAAGVSSRETVRRIGGRTGSLNAGAIIDQDSGAVVKGRVDRQPDHGGLDGVGGQ